MASAIPDDVTRLEQERLQARGYAPLEPFFILKEASVWDERNNKPLELNKTRLEEIARVQNDRIVKSGDFTPIIVGHTKREQPEALKQKPCGWASRFEVVEFGRGDNGRVIYGLRATPWAKPEHRKDFDDHPRRSVEMWTDPFLIDPISILGATTPRLDLGLHQLQRSGEPFDPILFNEYRPAGKLRFEMEDDMPSDFGNNGTPTSNSSDTGSTGKPAGGTNSLTAELFNSPEWKKMQEDLARCLNVTSQLEPLLNDMAGGGDMGGGAGAGGPMGAGNLPPDAGMPPGGGGGGGMPAQMNAYGGGGGAAGGAAPGGMNTMMPQQMQRYGTPPVQMQYHGGPTPEQQQIEVLQRHIMSLHLQMEGQKVNSLLDVLQNEIVVDRARDFETLIKLSRDEERQDMIQFWRSTRKAAVPDLPPEAVPLQFQLHQTPRQQQQGPISLQQAHEGYSFPGDPSLVGRPGATPTAAPQRSLHDMMLEAVRNRKNGQSTQEAFNAMMGQIGGTTSVRG